jgi:predicted TIM-barrel fold metal-dependent hydrolase
MAATGTATKSARVREGLDHPVIDGDGHMLEPVPVFLDFLRDEGGKRAVAQFRERAEARTQWYGADDETRIRDRLARQGYWTEAGNSRDRATAILPDLMYERLGDFGIDFALMYTSMGLGLQRVPEEEFRRSACRALNRTSAALMAPYADRMTPVASIPVYTPEEAVDELEYVTGELNLRAIMISGRVSRTVPSDPHRGFVDTIGIDNEQSYDPFWAKCVERGVAVTDHGGSLGWANRQGVTNYTFNHLAHHAESNHMGCRGVLLGGVLQRFPDLNFAYLEGGAGWAVTLLLDLIEHLHIRGPEGMRRLDPARVDVDVIRAEFAKHAKGLLEGRVDEVLESISAVCPFQTLAELSERESDHIDDFAASGIETAEQLREIFSRSFYFGCESDDRTAALSFDKKVLGTTLRPFFSSDVSHFDVPDMEEVLHEAWELVEDDMLTEEQFKQFTFSNVIDLHTRTNPDFFAGTAVEAEVAKYLSDR